MSERRTKPTWIKKVDTHWALAYLDGWSRRHPGQPSGAELYDRLCWIGTLKEDKSIDPDLPLKMKAAWAAKKFRNKKDQLKHCSFALSTESARQLDKLARGGTKIGTLERIILDRAEQEIAYKSDKKYEGIYKQRAKILEGHLDQALAELITYRLILTEAGIGYSQEPQRQKEVTRLVRERKNQVLSELPALPSKIAKGKQNRSMRSAPIAESAKQSAHIPPFINAPKHSPEDSATASSKYLSPVTTITQEEPLATQQPHETKELCSDSLTDTKCIPAAPNELSPMDAVTKELAEIFRKLNE
jgi:hypothetical protein